MISFFENFWQEETGQDMVEYALLLAFVALAAVTILTTVKTSINTLWTTVNTKLGTINTVAGS